MNADRKTTVIRLVIYLLISCVPGIFITIAANNALGAPMYSTPELSAHPVTTLVGLVMLLPAIANVTARLVTRQGFRDAMLEFNFTGRIRYYALAFAAPVVYGTIGTLLNLAYAGADLGAVFGTEHILDNLPLSLSLPPMILVQIIVFFGEEFGWRGYLIPQLEKLMPLPAAVIVGGIIWGLWHAPLTISGHNLGVDYPGFPYLGIFLMCADCVCMGAFLTLLTRRTKSVWPASVAHGMNNGATVLLLILFMSPDASAAGTENADRIISMTVYLIPTIIIGIVSFILLCRDWKKEKRAETSLTEMR